MNDITWTLPPHAAEVIALFSFPHGADLDGALWWRTYDDGRISVAAKCSDTFVWGSADCEPIEPEDMELLRQCLADLRKINEEYWLPELFAARKRNMRPAKFWMKRERPVIGLFEEIPPGPEDV